MNKESSLKNKTIAALGHGNMQNGIMHQLFEKEIIPRKNYTAIVRSQESQEKIIHGGLNATLDHSVVKDADIIFLSYKQADFWQEPIYENMDGKVVLSIIAGIQSKDIQEKFKGADIVQAMPNRGSVVGEGETFLLFPSGISQEKKDMVFELFCESGKVYEVHSGEKINISTIVNASMFGVIAFFKDKIEDILKGKDIQKSQEFFQILQKTILYLVDDYALFPEKSSEITDQIFLGVEKLSQDASWKEIQSSVTSPNGTTHAMVQTLENMGIQDFLNSIFEEKKFLRKDLSEELFLFLKPACEAGLKRAKELSLKKNFL